MTAGQAVTSGNLAALKMLVEHERFDTHECPVSFVLKASIVVGGTLTSIRQVEKAKSEWREFEDDIEFPMQTAIMGTSVETVDTLISGGMTVKYNVRYAA